MLMNVTEDAATQIREAAKQSGCEGMPLRLAARRESDGRIEYLMGFDEAKEEDLDVKTDGVTIVISVEHAPLLQGATMDFGEIEDGQKNFIFINPNDPHHVAPKEDKGQHRLS